MPWAKARTWATRSKAKTSGLLLQGIAGSWHQLSVILMEAVHDQVFTPTPVVTPPPKTDAPNLPRVWPLLSGEDRDTLAESSRATSALSDWNLSVESQSIRWAAVSTQRTCSDLIQSRICETRAQRPGIALPMRDCPRHKTSARLHDSGAGFSVSGVTADRTRGARIPQWS